VPADISLARRAAGQQKRQDAEIVFDADWYLRRYPEAASSGLSPLAHYIKIGAAAGYDPHPMFCTSWYLDRYPDIASARVNPLVHYVKHGGFEGRDPHPLFDTSWYLKSYPEVAATGLNPLIHYIQHGIAENRRPGPLLSGPDDWDMDHAVAAVARAEYDCQVDRVPPAPRALRPHGPISGRIAVLLTALGKRLYGQSRFLLASLTFRAALLLSAARRDELLALLAKCAIRQRQYDKAFDLFVARVNLKPSFEPMVRAAMPTVFRAAVARRSIGVMTSFMPRRIEVQQAALRSWREAGLSVVSVNSSTEAVELREHFPDVAFSIIDHPVEDHGRPFVPIRALMEAASATRVEVCGIINSDIEFRGEAGFFDTLREEVPGALVFGNRIDISDGAAKHEKAFRNGYDFFFWDRENTNLLTDTPMVLGLPWWDFWLPLHAHSQGLALKRTVTSGMIHPVHPIGWNTPNFVRYGHLCAQVLMRTYGRWNGGSPPADRVFLHNLFATAATIPVEYHPDTALRRVGVVCDLVNCVIDSLSETLILPDAYLAAGTMDII
jgi:hypothetical protein